ncbi:MAG: nicotinate-nicotinamide nucleotide adenylyltransferase [Legionellales bacterium]|nr:nicotinate-nicotinamide nucleotide adenylyltransferase [Legionellales bacterium]|tara:strand:+ start:4728 stop:5369 length:642 start_codon:yes stop_codon:yes gene_type:complete
MRLIGVLGGTFDPIHNGHLHLAVEVLNKLNLDEIKLIPSNIPPHRSATFASSTHRKEMVELAILDKDKLSIDLCEIKNQNISYTINTLKSLRREFPEDALFLIIGEDVFKNINTWEEWESLLEYSHILVTTRVENQNNDLCEEIKKWRDSNKTEDFNTMKKVTSGYIYFINTPVIKISSSMIRQCYIKNESVDNYLPSNVTSYIEKNNLYTEI